VEALIESRGGPDGGLRMGLTELELGVQLVRGQRRGDRSAPAIIVCAGRSTGSTTHTPVVPAWRLESSRRGITTTTARRLLKVVSLKAESESTDIPEVRTLALEPQLLGRIVRLTSLGHPAPPPGPRVHVRTWPTAGQAIERSLGMAAPPAIGHVGCEPAPRGAEGTRGRGGGTRRAMQLVVTLATQLCESDDGTVGALSQDLKPRQMHKSQRNRKLLTLVARINSPR
jgi:hypothetical protein